MPNKELYQHGHDTNWSYECWENQIDQNQHNMFAWNEFKKVHFLKARLNETQSHLPEVNSHRFEISLSGKVSLRRKVTLLSVFQWLRTKWNSLRCKFHFAQFDRIEISNYSEFFIPQHLFCIKYIHNIFIIRFCTNLEERLGFTRFQRTLPGNHKTMNKHS